jgi:hypothetical protein
LKSEAEQFDVFERKKAGSPQRAQQGLTFEKPLSRIACSESQVQREKSSCTRA